MFREDEDGAIIAQSEQNYDFYQRWLSSGVISGIRKEEQSCCWAYVCAYFEFNAWKMFICDYFLKPAIDASVYH